MSTRIPIFLGAICISVYSCQSDKVKRDAEGKTREFFSALKNDDKRELVGLYARFDKLEQYYKSDSAAIVSTTEAKGIVKVTVNNRFTNGFGKLSQERISLYFKGDSAGRAILFDSKGFSDFNENDDFIFGTKTGCIDSRTDTTDQQIISKLKKAKQLILSEAVSVYLELKTNVRVTNWSWESGFGGSGSGHGIVLNGSTYRIPNLKYKVSYMDEFGNTITSDAGTVSYDVLDAGESKSFTFYTSYIGGAHRASIELVFDEDMIFKYLSKKDWTGNECAEYFRTHKDTVMDR